MNGDQAPTQPWFFGLLREAGGYRIVAAGPSEARLRREIAHHANPTMVVTRDDLASLCIGDTEMRRWLPGAGAASSAGAATSSRTAAAARR